MADHKVDKFNGEGFYTWKTKIKLTLMKKGIWNVTNGKEKKPTNLVEEVDRDEDNVSSYVDKKNSQMQQQF